MSGVLVTGGTQPLGLEVGRLLLERGYDPVVLVGLEAPGEVDVPTGAVQVSTDLTRNRNVRRLLSEHDVDAVVHLAIHRDWRMRGAHRLHVDATRTLLRLCEAHGIGAFVHRSTAEVYRQKNDQPDLMREDQPLDLNADAPAWVHERVEADVTVSTRMGLAEGTRVSVLRCAEILAPDMGSQLHDYLSSRLCLRPLGFDPILNVLSLPDAARAFVLAVEARAVGAFNIPGADTLPLSRLIAAWGREQLAVPDALMGPAYRWRARTRGKQFDYDRNRWRFHFNGVLDGARAAEVLGYEPVVSAVRANREPGVMG